MFSAASTERALGEVLPPWWVFLFTAVGWMLLALILLRFDYTTVSAISILFGVIGIVFALRIHDQDAAASRQPAPTGATLKEPATAAVR